MRFERPITYALLSAIAATVVALVFVSAGTADVVRLQHLQRPIHRWHGIRVRRNVYAPHVKRNIKVGNVRWLGRVGATWYGPGLYGNRTSCGITLRPGTFGVAHRTFPCGTLMYLRFSGHSIAVPVIDRGPFGTAAQLDLTSAVASRIGFKRAGNGALRAAVMRHRFVEL